MNEVGRQMKRSSSTGHHQRQYSDNFIDNAFNNKWLRSAGLHHLQSSNSSMPALQDFGFFGNNGGGQSKSVRRDSLLPGEVSPGLLDLHSFDTDLIPELPSQNDGSLLNHPVQSRSFDDSDPFISDKLRKNGRVVPDNYFHKGFSVEGEKTHNVAKIKVVVRKRPLNKKEIARKEEDVITIDPHMNSLAVYETKLKVDLTGYVEKHEFVFDAVMNEDISNDDVYAETVQPIVPLVFQRTKATCFAYGQTGSGKTYTMQPLPLKASKDIFRLMQNNYQSQGFQLHVSFFEIYGGKVFDLLNERKKLCMREDGKQQVCIVGLQEYNVSSVETVRELIEKGNASRSTGTTGANEESSRSHAILQLAVKRKVDGNDSKPARPVGKLSFIDLAGSERGADTTDNDKQTRMEGAEINKSLLALKECIRALDNDQGHIPFRGSKLTEVLRDSFVGNSRTVMISCISPNSGSCEHTLNTLRYADRVKSLSKGGSSKREPLSLMNVRSSTVTPLEPSPSSNIDRVPSGRIQGNLASFAVVSEESLKEPGPTVDRVPSGRSHWNTPIYKIEEDVSSSQVTLEDLSLENQYVPELSILDPEGDFAALLKKEGDLVNAHRKQVEDTMDIVKQEMNLLVQIDQPGNQLDDYISRLNVILCQKAAGIVNLQNRLANFQKHLKVNQVFDFPSDH